MNRYDSQNSPGEQRQTARQLKTALMVGMMALGATLAVVIGNRLSNLAASILVGTVAGVAASVPVTFFLLLLFGNRSRPAADELEPVQMMPPAERPTTASYVRPAPMERPYPSQAMPAAQPAFVVIAPPGRYAWPDPGEPAAANYYPPPMPRLSPAPREFQVIGEADYSDEYEWNGR